MKNPTIFHPSEEKCPRRASSESPSKTIQAMARANSSQQKLGVGARDVYVSQRTGGDR
jgi:hypothetical protein